MPMSTTEAHTYLDALRGGALYCFLSTADPTPDGSGIAEPVGNGYARVTMAAKFPAASARALVNSVAVTFPAASGGDWGTLTHWGFASASSAGTVKWYAPLDASRTVLDGDTFSFPIGDLTVSLPS